ncbi:MAG: 16S rRNA (guanine(527)-N(7))-methyltransferase RsmG [Chloroflexota bacterium]
MEKLIAGASELGLSLTPVQLEQFQVYYRELVVWNRRTNLTAITGYEDVQLRHFLDSLSIATAVGEWLDQGERCRVLDVGSGAGLPGLPLKIAFPAIRLVLLDSVAKKTSFLLHLTELLRLEGVEIVTGRAEELAHREDYREASDVVLSRAVAPLSTLLELTLPFCHVGGVFVAQKKGKVDLEVEAAARAVTILGGNLREVKPIELESLPDGRYLVVVDKVTPSPLRYPRRTGVPARRPLL